MSSVGTLIMLCTNFLLFLLTVLLFILRTECPQILYILECNITTRDTTCTDNCPEICSGVESHLLEQIPCSIITSNLPLAEKFHVVLDHLDESNFTHFLWIADVQTTQVHLKEIVREAKLLGMGNKSCLNFTIICMYHDQVL